MPTSAATRLRQLLHQRDHIIVCPGVYDGFTARLALDAGFEALYMTGFGTSLSRLGQPDLGLATLNDMRANAEMIATLDPTVPLIADADTGYGGPIMVARTVTQYARSNVAALHLEDQVQAKRCGHLLGKELVEPESFYARIRAADAARRKVGSDIVIIARTDALAGMGFEEAVGRLRGAVEAGADVVFLEGLRTREECRRVCEVMGDVPVLLNLVPGGVTPNLSVAEAKEMGFRIMICPLMLLEAVREASTRALELLKAEGRVEDGGLGPRGLSALCGLQECLDIDKAAGGASLGGI